MNTGLDNIVCTQGKNTETWPSGKAGACKALIPGSNPGVSF